MVLCPTCKKDKNFKFCSNAFHLKFKPMDAKTKEQILEKYSPMERPNGYSNKVVYRAMQEYADQQTTALKDECERLRDLLKKCLYTLTETELLLQEEITNALNKTG